jgi:hypothetical protein
VVGAGILAAGRQLSWALAQCFCLLVSLALDPLLIPRFQARSGNGSLGVCVSVVVAEVAMVFAALRILPKGPLESSLLRTLLRCLCAALGMVAVGLLLRPLPLVAIPATVATYLAMLWLQGELDPELRALVRHAIVGKTGAASER